MNHKKYIKLEKVKMNKEPESKQKRQKKTTSKKVKVIGTQTYINAETKEVCEMQVISIEDRDFNFEKIWLGFILEALELIGNQKIKVLDHLLKNKNADNIVIKTQRQIAKEIGVSFRTVSITMTRLLEAGFIEKIQGGAYQISPDVIFKGSHQKRMKVLMDFQTRKQTKSKS